MLDEVMRWDADSLTAISRTHGIATHPLRMRGRIPALSAIEYAAQAMAVHGGLSGAIADRPRTGYLVSLRNVVCSVSYLDEIEGELAIEVRRLVGDAERVMYEFSLTIDEHEIISGQATVVLDADVSAA
jgi:predicted hotdog family 3-hydroxylacyl-ACP dehydratase